jgi:hypothetical protein
MVTQMPTSRAGRNAHVAAFLCGTFALALGLVLVLDPEDDDDQPLLISSSAASETQTAAKPATATKQLKVAKTHKLKPKKTALKKRSKRVFNLTESVPPAQGSQRPRRGFAQAPQLILPAQIPQLDLPDLTLARLLPGASDLPHASPQIRPQLIRGPPLPVRA